MNSVLLNQFILFCWNYLIPYIFWNFVSMMKFYNNLDLRDIKKYNFVDINI